MTNKILLLCGPANTGKTTFLNAVAGEFDFIVSAENAIASACKASDVDVGDFVQGRLTRTKHEEVSNTYEKIFSHMLYQAEDAVAQPDGGHTVYIDCRNIKPSKRKKILKHFNKEQAYIAAINFKHKGYSNLIEQLNAAKKQTGFNLSQEELHQTINSFVPAIAEEGFDEVIEIDALEKI